MAEIHEVAWDLHSVTYQGIQAEDHKESEITELYGSAAACVVKELLGLAEWPRATEENINFEAGFHQLVLEVQDILYEIIRLEEDDDWGVRIPPRVMITLIKYSLA